MSVPNIERGDKFIVQDSRHRGRHFTCVGETTDGGFLAGDTHGTVWKFSPEVGITYNVSIRREYTYEYRGQVPAEAIVKENV